MGGAPLVALNVEKDQTLDIAGAEYSHIDIRQPGISFQITIVQGSKGRILLHGSPWRLSQDKEL